MSNPLYGWIFTQNLDGRWAAAAREHQNELFNNYNSEHVIRSKSIETLQAIIVQKLKGDPRRIKAFKAAYS